MEIEKMLEEDFIKQIYYGEIYFSRYNPNTPEYNSINQKIQKISKRIRHEKAIEKDFIEYCETMAIKESMEAELQFKLGFKTAVRLMIYGLN